MSSERELVGKTAIVTGGSSGIGRAIVERLLQQDFKVVSFDRNAPSDLVEAPNFAFHAGDVSDQAEWDKVLERAENFGPVCRLVNAAGISGRVVADSMSAEGWLALLRVNLVGAWLGVRTVLPGMREHRFGRIVNISSIGSRLPFPFPEGAAYSASKGGVEAMTRAVALEVAPEGILVNAVAPGPVATAMTASMTDDLTRSISRQLPVGRWAEPPAIASIVAYLLSSECEFITGQVIDVDGGLGLSALHTAGRQTSES
ncbi:MAG: SDR family oxidoreductase [Devosia sp.]|nr:SDR family oxidoreductase [Devosia sp.]